jgi:succinyl-diaminopimelate desuccinylase
MSALAFDPSDPVALAQALIRYPSVTPDAGGAIALLDAVLASAGFETHRLTFSEPGQADVDNLFARCGSAGPSLVLAGHVDVVPPGDETKWRHPPFSGVIEGGEVWGRGAVDMKGGVAAAVAAALRHRTAHPDTALAFLITGDEEGPAVNGTRKVLDWAKAQGIRLGHCLLGEPTNPNGLGDAIKIGRRGSLSGRITVEGIQGHVAYPHLARNPATGMIRLLAALTAERLDEGSAHFDPSNLEVTSIDVGNPAFNVIPGEARAAFNIRFNDRWTRASLESFVAECLQRAAGDDVRYRLSFESTHSEAFLTAPGPFVELVAAAVEAETGRSAALSTSGGTSDARFIKDHCPVVEFGLVGRTMHQIDERTPIADLEALTRIYEGVILRYRDFVTEP